MEIDRLVHIRYRRQCQSLAQCTWKAGKLTVLSTDPLLHKGPVQLDFHFRLTPQTSAHWHGLLCDHRLFLDIPYRALDQGNRESLTAALEYVEEKTNVDSVFVNFQNNRNDRGALLRAFSYMGFEVVRPDHPALPPWDNVIFMVIAPIPGPSLLREQVQPRSETPNQRHAFIDSCGTTQAT
ncbi:hypothetical protein MJG53_001353 [Ovis ammon polii x Ovis aries]|uniref:Uncharacterized protein n=1 Tax=Ovis ammon polii x Ovis aries TaxID=2918886 RepID=A0ACB9VLA0_9CETA|nr:hypothetical protein MJG53_001353 [Ovis ammon polii x Ovis aries]